MGGVRTEPGKLGLLRKIRKHKPGRKPQPSGHKPRKSRRFPIAPIKPAGVYAYIDSLQLWLDRPLPKKRLRWLKARCDLHISDKPHRFEPRYRQRIQIRQPTPEVLRFLAEQSGLLLNHTEIALDWTFSTEHETEEALIFTARHLIKKHHREAHGIRIVGEGERRTLYTNTRAARNVVVLYADKYCRVTGEECCVHLEWRMNGVEALRRAGIHSIEDLLSLDYRQFWAKRLVLADVDYPHFGRLLCIHCNKKPKRRRADITRIGRFEHDNDSALASNALFASNRSIQALIDKYRKHFDVNRCLIPFDSTELLPPVLYYDYEPKSHEHPDNI